MTYEKQQLCAQAYALQGDERIVFADANGISGAEFSEYVQTHGKHRTKRSSKHQRKMANTTQSGVCALCESELTGVQRIDHINGKILHVGCQLYIGRARKMIANGITLDRLADYLQLIRPAPSLDPFSPDTPDVDI